MRHAFGTRLIDLGCGLAATVPFRGHVSYVGIDLNAAHISRASTHHGDKGRFHCGDFASPTDELAGTFDLLLCLGLLHHLDDQRVAELGNLALAYLVPGGRFLAIDPVFTDDQPWITRRVAAAESGPIRARSTGL